MKQLQQYINESNYDSSNLEDLKKQLLKMKKGDRIRALWGVRQKATDASGKDRMVDHALSIDKIIGDKYDFCVDFCFPQGIDMIKAICKDLGIKKWARILDMSIVFDYEDLVKVLDEMPKYFSKYANEKKFFTFVSFDSQEVEKECEKQRRPFQITSLKDEIAATEKAIKELEQKKAKLQELQHAQAEEDTWKWVNGEK